MRFADRISFVTRAESYYDPDKGEYVESEPIEDVKPCNLSTLSTQRTNELFGSINEMVTVARLQRPYNKDFDYVLIDNEKYEVTRQSDYRKGVFYLRGVQHGD